MKRKSEKINLDESILGWILKNKIRNERGDLIEFDEHYFLLEPFANWHPKQVCMKSAQVGWSTLAIIKTLYAAIYKKFNIIYTVPTADDVRDFVPSKVDQIITANEVLRTIMGTSDAISKKQVGNNFIWYRGTSGTKQAMMHSSDLNCYEPGTEILTENGWKCIENVELTDKIYTRNKCGIVELHYPTAIINKDYDGDLLRFQCRSFDLGVTPEHKMFGKLGILKQAVLIEAREIENNLKESRYSRLRQFSMTAQAKWRSPDLQWFILPDVKHKKRIQGSSLLPEKEFVYSGSEFPIKPFFRFMGWYLSEGNVVRHRGRLLGSVVITQKEGQYAEEIRQCLDDCGFQWQEYTNFKGVVSFRITHHHLAYYLAELGNSFQKYIPQEMLQCVGALPYLIETLLKGDGCHSKKHKSVVLNTASPKLADTLQIAWLKLGMMATIRPFTEKSGTIMYRVLGLQNEYKVWGGTGKGRIVREKYKGKVHCVTVQNHVVMVRDKKNKTPIWSGNCHDEYDASQLDTVDMYTSRLQRSKYKGEWLFSNPIMPGGIDKKFEKSDKRRWMIRCSRCNHWQWLDFWKNIDKRRGEYICAKCKCILSEEDRHDGEWIAEYFGRDVHGYHINQLMAPWVTAKELVYLEKNKMQPYFYNMVLGLPHVNKDEVVNRTIITRNINTKQNTQMRNAMGIDVGYRALHFVLGNHEGIFRVGTIEGEKCWEELEMYIKKYNPIVVIDGNPDFYPRRTLMPAHPGRVFCCFYRKNAQRKDLIEWGDGDSRGYVFTDRSQAIQAAVDDFMSGQTKFTTNGREPESYADSELKMYIKHWENIYKVIKEDSLGIPQTKWEKAGDDHLVHATVYFRIALSRVPKAENTFSSFSHMGNAIISPEVINGQMSIEMLKFLRQRDPDAWKYT